jgi:uncharacterized spore protein YtfJ
MNQETSRAMREAEDAASGHFDDFVSALASRIGMRASASAVFGDAVTRDDVTVIPVAKVRWGFGGGSGRGADSDENGDPNTGEGSGGGGGVMASPLGYIEIRDGEAVFRRIKDVGAYVPIILASTFAGWVALRSLKKLFS